MLVSEHRASCMTDHLFYIFTDILIDIDCMILQIYYFYSMILIKTICYLKWFFLIVPQSILRSSLASCPHCPLSVLAAGADKKLFLLRRCFCILLLFDDQRKVKNWTRTSQRPAITRQFYFWTYCVRFHLEVVNNPFQVMKDRQTAPGDGIRSLKTSRVFRIINFELYSKPVI
jgi:hypothetical protein